jgi:site-specific DNA-cytosine methylase
MIDAAPGESFFQSILNYTNKYGNYPPSWLETSKITGITTAANYERQYVDSLTGRQKYLADDRVPHKMDYSKHHKLITGDSIRRLIHPTIHRPPTHREVARLMGFPDDWTIAPYIHKSATQKTWGKGVTVHVGEWIGQQLMASAYGTELPGIKVEAQPLEKFHRTKRKYSSLNERETVVDVSKPVYSDET